MFTFHGTRDGGATFTDLPVPASTTLTLSGKRDKTSITAVFTTDDPNAAELLPWRDLQQDILVRWHGVDWHYFGAGPATYIQNEGRKEVRVEFKIGPWRLNDARRARNNILLRADLATNLTQLIRDIPSVTAPLGAAEAFGWDNQVDYWQSIIGSEAEFIETLYESVLDINYNWDDAVRALFDNFWLLVQVRPDYEITNNRAMNLVCCLDPILTTDTELTVLPSTVKYEYTSRADLLPNELIKIFWLDNGKPGDTYEFNSDLVDLNDKPNITTNPNSSYIGHWPDRPAAWPAAPATGPDTRYQQLIFDRTYWSSVEYVDRAHARLDAELQQLKLYRGNRTATVTIPCFTITELDKYRPGSKVRHAAQNWWVTELTVRVPDYTMELDLVLPFDSPGPPREASFNVE